MSQNNVDYSLNPTGPQLMDNYLAKDQENCLTTNSGIQRPSYAQAGTKWLDTSATPWNFYMYDGTADVLIGTVNPTTHEFISSNSANVVNLTDNQTIGGIKTFNGSIIVPDRTNGDNTTNAANTKFVRNAISDLQPSNTAVTHTASTAVGSGTNPVYVSSNGAVTASSRTVGSAGQPVYMNNGSITPCIVDEVHVVVDSYRSGYSWYRVYDDGWVEQGGRETDISSSKTVSLLKAMSDNKYTILLGQNGTASNQDGTNVFFFDQTSNDFKLGNKQYGTSGQSRNCYWTVAGIGA